MLDLRSRPNRSAALFAAALALVFALIGAVAWERERDHAHEFIDQASAVESRWAYTLLMQAVDPVLAQRRGGDLDAQVRARIDQTAERLAARSSIRKVKLFDVTGRLLHAVPAVAPDAHPDATVQRAIREGRVASEMRRVDGFRGIGGRIVDGHIAGTYFPHVTGEDSNARPDLVVEIYVDVSEAVQRAGEDFRSHGVMLVASLGVLYLLIVGAVLWGTRAVRRMQAMQEQNVQSTIRNERQLREAKRRAEENEAFLREAIGSMEYGFLLLDPEKRCLFWNDRYVELLPPLAPVLKRGATLHDLIAALSHSDLYAIPEAERERWTDAAVPRLWSGQPFRRRLTSGRTLRIALMPTRDGGRVLSLQDVTDDVAAEDRMTRLGLVAEHTDNAVLIASADGVVEWANAGFTRMTGHDLSEIEGRKLADVLDLPEGDMRERQRIGAAIAEGTSFDAELRSRSKAGERYWLQLASTPVRDDIGHVMRHVVIASDVTTRKDQEQRLAEALSRERELAAQQKRFVAVAAHELRTPLTIIDGAAQRLARNADWIAPEELRERAARIRAGVARLAELVNTTLDSARLDEGRIDLELRTVDLSALIADVVRRLTGMAGAMQVDIAGGDRPVEIEGDGRLLDQVFGNLVSNAVKYSGDSRRIEIEIVDAPSTDLVSVVVRDFGIGIPEAELPKLFERFYRASTAKGLPGTGIGLNLVRELVALHGGSVEVSSTVGKGSAFIVRLPRRQIRNDPAAEDPRAAE